MLTTGVDLVRVAGQQNDKVERLRLLEPLAPTSAPVGQGGMNWEGDTPSALKRFARFISEQNQDRDGKNSRSKTKPVPAKSQQSQHRHPFFTIVARLDGEGERGTLLNIRV